MRCFVLLLLGLLVVPTCCLAGDFLDTFAYADGTFPPGWTWTGDPRGGGVFLVQDEAFTHTSGGHVHYFKPTVCGVGEYEFEVKGDLWTYAWRIEPTGPLSGRCLFLHPWYAFGEFSWTTLGGYPEGQYMYHNGSFSRRVYNNVVPEPGWHHIRIVDEGDRVQIYADGDLVFDETFDPIPDGYVGLGSDTGSGAGFPAFDNVGYAETITPVNRETWGSVKTVYR